jgi:hypothetical protein
LPPNVQQEPAGPRNDDAVIISDSALRQRSAGDVARQVNALAEQLRAGTLDARAVGEAFRESFQQAGEVFADFLRKIGASDNAIETALKSFLVDTQKAAGDTIRGGGFEFARSGEALSINVTNVRLDLKTAGPKGGSSLSIDLSQIEVSFASYSANSKAPTVPNLSLTAAGAEGAQAKVEAGASAPKLSAALRDIGVLDSSDSLPLKPLRVLGSSEMPKPMPFNLSIELGLPLRLHFTPANIHISVKA